MAVFAYKAVDLYFKPAKGTIIADTPQQAREQLRAKGLTIQEVIHSTSANSSSTFRSRRLRRHLQPKVASFVRELSTLLGAGIPLVEALDSIAQQYKGHFQTCVLLLRDRICAGMGLAEAMREQPAAFDDLCTNITEVGEHTGTLDAVLTQLAEFKERSNLFKDRVGTALLYPTFVLLMGVGISIFLMTYVVPELLSALVSNGRPLPIATRMVKGLSDLLVQRWWIFSLTGVAAFVGARAGLKTRRGLLAWHRLQLRVPILGVWVRKQAVVRIALVLSTLLRGGVVLVKAVQIARSCTSNLILQDALKRFECALSAGQDLSVALEATQVFPRTVVQMMSVGQESGRLEEMLDRLAADYDQQLKTAAQRLTAMLEPLLIICLAIVVGFIAFATILPILEAGNAL